MRAAVLERFGHNITVHDVTLNAPAAGQVLVRTTATPFCATDWMSWRGMRNRRVPVILGHAGAGVVEAVGEGVTTVKPGDRVVVPGTPECGDCFYCRIGRPDQCSLLMEQTGDPVVGTYLNESGATAVMAAGRVGSYSEYMLVSAAQVWAVETDLPDDQLSLLGCGITTGLGSVFNVAKVQPGDSVAIVGLGQVGQWMVQAAALAGATTIIALDLKQSRRDLALAFGATHVLDPQSGDPVAAVRALTEGRGADHALEAAGPDIAMQHAFAMSRRAGTVVLTGTQHWQGTVALPMGALALQGRRVVACQNGQSVMGRDLPRYIAMLEDGRLNALPIITAHYSLEKINDALEAAGQWRDLSGIIIPGS
jgi:S-(hydroxymethyl)glutathione dehydrogenase/alcohol dehydrogenase